MTWLNAWILFGLIPLFLLYKKSPKRANPKQNRLLYLSLCFMIIGLARPALENHYVKQTFDARDFIIALDVSYSMQATDLKPSRYLLAKEAIKKLIRAHPKDRFTLFAFTSSALLISPPTSDTEVSILALDALNPKYILTKSTNLKKLFSTIGRLPLKQKNLILFTDGGDEQDIATLASIAKHHTITPYIVATATQKGAALKKNGSYIKRANDSIVISKINPMLIDLANATHGRYYQLKELSIVNAIVEDISFNETKKEHIEVKSYQELFYIPVALAWLLFFLAVTRLGQKLFIVIPLLFLYPPNTHAKLLDFYYLNQAQKAYAQKEYTQAAIDFKKLSPSTQSFYNLATAFAKAGLCRDALKFYAQIQTKDATLKAKIYYNMGYCAAILKHYKKAKHYFIYALALNENDADALFNLNLLRRLNLKKPQDVSKMLPQNQSHKRAKNQQGDTNRKKSRNQHDSSSSKSNNQSGMVQSGGGTQSQKAKQKLGIKTHNKPKKGHYSFSYKAYEKINKGYTDEKEPW